MRIHLQRIVPDENVRRFYTVLVQPSLFGDWSVVREWGRIGQGGTVRGKGYGSEAEARVVADEAVSGKLRRGYRVHG